MKRKRRLRRAAPAVVLLVLILAGTLKWFISIQSNTLASPTPDVYRSIAENRQNGRYAQALYDVEAVAAQSGWTPELNRQAGDLWLEMGDETRAVPYWEVAADTQPDTLLLRQLAQAYVDLQRWTDARDALKHLTDLDPTDAWAHYQLGLLLAPFDTRTADTQLAAVAGVEAYSSTVRALRAVLADNPTDPLISMRVGLTLADHDLWAYAELAFNQAATIASPFPEALAYVGLARDKQGKNGSQWLDQAVALAPQNPRVLYVQGLHFRARGDYAKSLTALQEAVILDPQNPALNAELSTAYRLIGDLPRAEGWLKIAVVMSGNDPKFQKLLALFYADNANSLTPAGVDTLEHTSDSLPDDADVKASYGWALHQIGQTQRAALAIEAALKLDPDNPRALFYKARILLDTEHKDEAIPLLRRVVELKGLFADDARRILATLGV